jgi:hypothetical protein
MALFQFAVFFAKASLVEDFDLVFTATVFEHCFLAPWYIGGKTVGVLFFEKIFAPTSGHFPRFSPQLPGCLS